MYPAPSHNPACSIWQTCHQTCLDQWLDTKARSMLDGGLMPPWMRDAYPVSSNVLDRASVLEFHLACPLCKIPLLSADDHLNRRRSTGSGSVHPTAPNRGSQPQSWITPDGIRLYPDRAALPVVQRDRQMRLPVVPGGSSQPQSWITPGGIQLHPEWRSQTPEDWEMEAVAGTPINRRQEALSTEEYLRLRNASVDQLPADRSSSRPRLLGTQNPQIRREFQRPPPGNAEHGEGERGATGEFRIQYVTSRPNGVHEGERVATVVRVNRNSEGIEPEIPDGPRASERASHLRRDRDHFRARFPSRDATPMARLRNFVQRVAHRLDVLTGGPDAIDYHNQLRNQRYYSAADIARRGGSRSRPSASEIATYEAYE